MEFKKYRLGEIATFSQGKQVDVKEQYATKGKDMKKFTRIVDYTNASEPVRYVENYGDRYFASEDELVMIRYGSQTAGMAVMGKNGIIANNLFKINLNNDIVLNKYMYYCLSQKEIFSYLRSSQSSSTMPAISFSIMNSLEIDIPSIDYQKKAINILLKIEKKQELNNKINDNLYKLLKAKFKINFYNKNSDAKLLDYISNTIGGDWGKELPVDNYNTKVYCVRGADIPNMEYGNKGNAPTRYILEKNYNNKKLKPNNIIVEISGGSPTQSTGRTAYITENILNMYDAPLLCTNFCRAIETKKNIYAPFVYMYLTLMYEDDIFFNWENGTTGIKNLALNDLLSNIEITQPNEEELNHYYILFNSIMNKISNNSNENIKLELLRDTLLPKLMNGEINLDKIEI